MPYATIRGIVWLVVHVNVLKNGYYLNDPRRGSFLFTPLLYFSAGQGHFYALRKVHRY